MNSQIPQRLEDILNGLLEVNVANRIPSAEELKSLLSNI